MNKEIGFTKKGIHDCKKNVQKRWKQGEMLQRRNGKTLSSKQSLLGKLKLNCIKDWQETWAPERLLLPDQNKQGKCGLLADWGKSAADTQKAELLNAFFAPVFTNKVCQAFTHTDRVQEEEEIPTGEKDWSHKSLEKSWLIEVHESRWDASESAERAGWWHIKAVFCHHGHGDQGKSQMNGEGQMLQPSSSCFSQHPCVQVWPLWSRWTHYQRSKKCLDSGIEK